MFDAFPPAITEVVLKEWDTRGSTLMALMELTIAAVHVGEAAGFQHGQSPREQLLRRLKQNLQRPPGNTGAGGKEGRKKDDGGVGVMAAGVHHAPVLRGERVAAVLVYW